MKIKYRVGVNFNQEQVKKLKALNIEVNIGFDVFVINIDAPNLTLIKKIIGDSWENNIIFETKFSESDRENATYLNVSPTKIFGYPQPEYSEHEYPFDVYPYLEGIFDIEKIDPEYGILKGKQIGNFKLKKEPNWGSSSIGSAFNITDFIFVKPKIYQEIFQPLGIKCLPVLQYKTRKELKTVVQLVPQGIAESNLDIKEEQINEIQEVESWGIKKHILFDHGYYPNFISDLGNFDFFVTKEYFGSGGMTDREVIISQKLYQLLKKYKVKGLHYSPMSL